MTHDPILTSSTPRPRVPLLMSRIALKEPVMEVCKFKLGQSVEFARSVRQGPLGMFKITRVMPNERGIQQYRVKSVMDGHERMVMESDLA
jgi:hypothetical protein